MFGAGRDPRVWRAVFGGVFGPGQPRQRRGRANHTSGTDASNWTLAPKGPLPPVPRNEWFIVAAPAGGLLMKTHNAPAPVCRVEFPSMVVAPNAAPNCAVRFCVGTDPLTSNVQLLIVNGTLFVFWMTTW